MGRFAYDPVNAYARVAMRRTALGFISILLLGVACSGQGHGREVDIGGRSLFIDCRGSGSPTVISRAA